MSRSLLDLGIRGLSGHSDGLLLSQSLENDHLGRVGVIVKGAIVDECDGYSEEDFR
ncbi:hypothetical protein ABZ756_01575 [Mammaliicoccus sciuri]